MKTKIYFYGDIDLDLTDVNDRGTIDNWIIKAIREDN